MRLYPFILLLLSFLPAGFADDGDDVTEAIEVIEVTEVIELDFSSSSSSPLPQCADNEVLCVGVNKTNCVPFNTSCPPDEVQSSSVSPVKRHRISANEVIVLVVFIGLIIVPSVFCIVCNARRLRRVKSQVMKETESATPRRHASSNLYTKRGV